VVWMTGGGAIAPVNGAVFAVKDGVLLSVAAT
jgi:hypothetical protein